MRGFISLVCLIWRIGPISNWSVSSVKFLLHKDASNLLVACILFNGIVFWQKWWSQYKGSTSFAFCFWKVYTLVVSSSLKVLPLTFTKFIIPRGGNTSDFLARNSKIHCINTYIIGYMPGWLFVCVYIQCSSFLLKLRGSQTQLARQR